MAMKQHINIVAQIIPIGNIGGCWSAIVASSACNPVAACPFVVVKGIISEKMHSLEAHCRQLLRQKRRYCPLSSSCGEIALENSVVHCIAAHPSCTPAQRATLRRWPAGQLRLFFVYLLGMCNERIASSYRLSFF